MAVYLFNLGAYVLGDRTLFRFATGALSRDTKSSLLVSDYSKAPECPFPCALIDALSLYLHLLDENCPIKFDKIIFAGDSAGGGLSLSLLLYLKDHSMKLPDGVIGLSPWIDLTFSHPSLLLNRPFDYITSVIGDEKTDRDKDWLHNDRIYYYCTDNTQLNSPYVSPVYYSGSSSDFPPILIQFGEAELLRDEQLGFFTKVMPKANIRLEMYTDMIHVFQYIFRFSTQSITALERIAKFIESIERGDKIYRQALIVTGSQIKPFVDPFSIVVEGKKIVDEMRSEGILEWWDSYQKVHGLTTPKYLQDL